MTNVSETRDEQKERTRRRVREAALEVFRRDGVAAASIDEVVKRAGTSRGTFYFHFPTKDDVLADVLSDSGKRAAAALDALPVRTSLGKVLEALAMALAAEWQSDPSLFAEVGLVALRLTAAGKLTSETDPVRAAMARRFAALQASHRLTRGLPAAMLADTFLLQAFAALSSWAARPDVPLGKVLRQVTRLFLEGAKAG